MTTILSSINLCPINFREFDQLNKKLNNLEASVLFSRIKFNQSNSKIKRAGKTYIIRSRDQIASWFGFSLKKVDRLLSILNEKNLIEKRTGSWYGTKKLFITTTDQFDKIPVNLKILNNLTHSIGCLKTALVFSKIAYSFSKSNIQHKGLKWCTIKKKALSIWAGVSIRTLDKILESILKKGLVLKKNFLWKEKVQTHFHIPDFSIKSLKTCEQQPYKPNINRSSNVQNCRLIPAKTGASIILRTKIKEKNNSNTFKTFTKHKKQSDITFHKIGKELTYRQLRYLTSAIEKTITKKNIKISNPTEVLEQLKFSIVNPQQIKGITQFKHATSFCMKILGDNNWKTPIGFYKFSPIGKKIKENIEKREAAYHQEKKILLQRRNLNIEIHDNYSPHRLNLDCLTQEGIINMRVHGQ